MAGDGGTEETTGTRDNKNSDSSMTQIDCMSEVHSKNKKKDCSSVTYPLLRHTLYRLPLTNHFNVKECKQKASNLQHNSINVLHEFLFYEDCECLWLHLDFLNRNLCMGHVEDFSTIYLQEQQFKLNQFI
jgi:hypothetical protein